MRSQHLLFLELAFCLCACKYENQDNAKIEYQQVNPLIGGTEEPVFRRGEIIKVVVNKFDSSQSYCLFIPANADTLKCKAILFFDPKGDGSIPVMKYQAVAEKYGMILAGSNDSRNGLKPEQTAAIARNLVNDILTRTKLTREKIIAIGFSGGARVAVQTAISETLSGVIGCGAGFPFEPARSYAFPFIGIAGNEDFNYLEMKRLHGKLESLGMRHQFVVFDGGHEWPSLGRMEIAFLCLTALADKRKISDDKRAAELLAQDSAHLLNETGITEIDQAEVIRQSDIAHAFSSRDFKYLNDKIRRLATPGKESGREQELSNKRLLNFISLMGFLYSEKALGMDLALASQYLDIYEKADFDNPDYHYLKACYFAEGGGKDNAIMELKKSVEYGFNDYEKLTGNKSFDNLLGEPDFIKLADSLKAAQ